MKKRCVKVVKKNAQKTIKELTEKKMIDKDYILEKDEDYVYVPLKENVDVYKRYLSKIDVRDLKKHKKKTTNFKQILVKKIPKEDLLKINRSYDIVGDIVIVGIEDGLKKYYEDIGQAITKVHPQVKVVLKKKDHVGVYRTQVLEHVYGEKRKETVIKENNVKIKIDVEKVFCSTRLSSERKRIAKLVKEKEEVCVFFAGAGPFCLCVAKNSRANKVYGVELNPVAVRFFKKNIELNNLESKVVCVKGDVSVVSKKHKQKFDRIVMPHPTESEKFLKDAVYCLKDEGTIHFYKFVLKENAFKETKEILKKWLKKDYAKIKIENKKILLSYSPSVIEVVYDLRYVR